MIKLNKEEALRTVIAFLKGHYNRTKSYDTGLIIDSLTHSNASILFNNFMESLDKIHNEFINENKVVNSVPLFTEEEVFEAMIGVLDKYYIKTNSDDIGVLLGGLLHAEYGDTADSAFFDDWQDVLNQEKTRQQ